VTQSRVDRVPNVCTTGVQVVLNITDSLFCRQLLIHRMNHLRRQLQSRISLTSQTPAATNAHASTPLQLGEPDIGGRKVTTTNQGFAERPISDTVGTAPTGHHIAKAPTRLPGSTGDAAPTERGELGLISGKPAPVIPGLVQGFPVQPLQEPISKTNETIPARLNGARSCVAQVSITIGGVESTPSTFANFSRNDASVGDFKAESSSPPSDEQRSPRRSPTSGAVYVTASNASNSPEVKSGR
jgi:hypothetical protein